MKSSRSLTIISLLLATLLALVTNVITNMLPQNIQLFLSEHPWLMPTTFLILLASTIFVAWLSTRAGSDTTIVSRNSTELSATTHATNINGSNATLTMSRYPHANLVNWGSVVTANVCYGRESEHTNIVNWVASGRCRLLGIFGRGGIGKTTLAAKAFDSLASEFENVIWYSLLNEPPVEELLIEIIQLLSKDEIIPIAVYFDEQLLQLLSMLQKHRYLLVLDNLESLMGENAGEFKSQHEKYAQLINRIGLSIHMSCLIVTSRQKPVEFMVLEGRNSPVKSVDLDGVSTRVLEKLLNEYSLHGNRTQLVRLVQMYGGNPLFLKLAIGRIRTVYGGNISAYLERERSLDENIANVIQEQFDILSPHEKAIMFWFAIERRPLGLDELLRHIVLPLKEGTLTSILDSLKRRSLIHGYDPTGFFLLPEILAYVTSKFVEQIRTELQGYSLELFITHPLLTTHSAEHVRNVQQRLILGRIAEKLENDFTPQIIKEKIFRILSDLHRAPKNATGYAGGNLINLCIRLEIELNNMDFSGICIWEADLKHINLQYINFSGSEFRRTLFRYRFGSILAIAFSPDGLLFATGSSRGEVCLWRTSNGELMHIFEGHNDWVRSLTFSPDGNQLASGGGDETIKLWNVTSKKIIATLVGHKNQVKAVSFSPDGKQLVSVGDDAQIIVWDVAKRESINILRENQGWILSVDYDPSGDHIASGGDDKTVTIRRISEQYKIICKLSGHEGAILSIQFSQDSKLIASTGSDGLIKIWDIENQQCLKTLVGHNSKVRKAVFNKDASIVASAGDDRTIRIWDIESAVSTTILRGHTGRVRAISFNPTSKIIATGGDDHTVRLWDPTKGKILSVFSGYFAPIWTVGYLPQSDHVFAAGGTGRFTVWNSRSYEIEFQAHGHDDGIRKIAISLDGQMVATAGRDGRCCIWDTEHYSQLTVFDGHRGEAMVVTFHPNGRFVASAGDDQIIHIWNTTSGDQVASLEGHIAPIWALAFSPDGHLLASGGDDNSVKLWDTHDWKEIGTVGTHANPVLNLIFDPNSTLLYSASSDRSVKVWNVRIMHQVDHYQDHQGPVWSVALNKDGTLLATGGGDQLIHIRNLKTGDKKALLGHKGIVRSVSFSHDDRYLLSGSDDETVAVWSLISSQCEAKFTEKRPYEGMIISEAVGLNQAENRNLVELGARNSSLPTI